MMDSDLRVGQESDAGSVRQGNEDYVECFIPSDEAQLRTKGAIFLVADGMGGHQAGGVASRKAVERVIQEYYADETHDVCESLIRAFESANLMVFDLAQTDPSRAGMGTTLVAAVILGRSMYVANVGDSRAYLLRRRRFTQLTADHSWVEEQVRDGILTREQAEKHPQRNLITRALGTRPRVEIDLFDAQLGDGDVLLLCTDGLSSQVPDHELAHYAGSLPPPQAAAGLVAQANKQGGRDNASVMIVQVGVRRREIGVPRVLGMPWPAKPQQRLVVGLAALAIACLCVLVATFPVANQRLVGDPAAAPQPAPIRFMDLALGDLVPLADYLDYADLDHMRSAHSGQYDLGTAPAADLSPAHQGIFLVGLVRDWNCEAETCRFRLEMADKAYDVELAQGLFAGDPPSLQGRRVRLFGQQSPLDEVVDTRLIDLGARWWVWWQPAWTTMYQDHDWDEEVWVYSIVDHNPYSTIEMDDYPALERGDRILTRGRWLKGEPKDSMVFAVESLYHLEDGVYQPLSGGPSTAPQATVVLEPTGTATGH
jgi:serine/threonine protein phosphatase PrpC